MMGLSKNFSSATRVLLLILCSAFPFNESLAAGSCRLYADPSMSGAFVDVPEGASLDLATVGLKDAISSIRLSPGQSLQYWTWGQTNSGDRGIIYKVSANSYQSTNNQNLNPEYWLNTNDDFDVVRCDNFSRWEAILYADPDRSGGRVYLLPNTVYQSLDSINLLNQISSVELRVGTRLYYNYYSWGSQKDGWIQKDYSGQYSSSAGGADNNPEHWLKTNDLFSQVTATNIMPVYIQRHGVTDDGTNITAAGITALQSAWNTADCRLISNNTSVYYQAGNSDVTERNRQTAQIVKQALESHCPSTSVSTFELDVPNTSAQSATAVMNKIQEQNNSTTRIFVLGSTLLRKLTVESDCGTTPCYLQQWPAFMTLWNASRSLQVCQAGDPLDRQFMYNNIYRVQKFFVAGSSLSPVCMSSIRVPVDAYSNSGCGTEQVNYSAANTCPTP